jgi:hypothetical protein
MRGRSAIATIQAWIARPTASGSSAWRGQKNPRDVIAQTIVSKTKITAAAAASIRSIRA